MVISMLDNRFGKIKAAAVHTALMLALLGAATAVGYLFRYLGFPETNNVLIYLPAVLLTAWRTDGYLYGITASIIATFAYNFFFTEPYFTLQVRNESYWVTFAVMTVIAVVTSTLTSHAKKSSREALEKEAEAEAVYSLTYRLSDAKNVREITDIILGAIGEYLGCTAELVDVNKNELPDHRHLRPPPQVRARGGGEAPERKSSYVRLQKDLYADEAAWPILGRESVLGIIRIPRERALSPESGTAAADALHGGEHRHGDGAIAGGRAEYQGAPARRAGALPGKSPPRHFPRPAHAAFRYHRYVGDAPGDDG